MRSALPLESTPISPMFELLLLLQPALLFVLLLAAFIKPNSTASPNNDDSPIVSLSFALLHSPLAHLALSLSHSFRPDPCRRSSVQDPFSPNLTPPQPARLELCSQPGSPPLLLPWAPSPDHPLVLAIQPSRLGTSRRPNLDQKEQTGRPFCMGESDGLGWSVGHGCVGVPKDSSIR